MCPAIFIAQSPGCPYVTASGSGTIDCSTPCLNLSASLFETGESTSYAVTSIPYAPPFSFTAGTTIFAGMDDSWTGVLPIPFDFCFYGNTYDEIVVGANGLITFDVTRANMYCAYQFTDPCPTPGPPPMGLYNNSIMGAYLDIDPTIPTGGGITYNISGTAPCRTFVVNYYNIGQFNCTFQTVTQQIVLYETTNAIDVYIQDLPICASWNGGLAVIGIQDATGANGISPPGRNTGQWGTTNEAWRFTPNGTPNYAFRWHDQTGATVGTNLNLTVCPNVNTTYTAEVIYTDCNGAVVIATDSAIVTISSDIPIVNAGNDTTICDGESVSIGGAPTASGGAGTFTYNWSPGTGLSSTTIANPTSTPPIGTYTYGIGATDAGGCTGYDSVTVSVIMCCEAIAEFSYTTECFGTATSFTDLSTVSGGTINSWEWDFENDGVVDNTTQNPTYVYPAAGSYTVGLYASDGSGCVDTILHVITVNPMPEPDFTNVPVCLGFPTNFTDLSTISSGTISSWSWAFGDLAGGTDNVQNPTYSYAVAGTYNATLVITSDNGCVDSITHQVTVNDTYTANFTAPDVCVGIATSFTDISTSSGSTITSWEWDFDGDGVVDDITQNPSYTFLSAGTYPVHLTIPGTCGHDTIIDVEVLPSATADFSSTTECFGAATQFTNLSTGTVWQWDFDNDGVIDNTTQNPSYIYPAPGTYTVQLFTSFGVGCADSITHQVLINPIPVADFTAANVCVGATTTFTDLSTLSSGSITSWEWDFDGDGVVDDITQNPSYTFSIVGTHPVHLTIPGACGHDTIIDVEVLPSATADFSSTIECFGAATQFTNLSTGTVWQWDFDNDGVIDNTTQNPTYVFPSPGSYTVQLFASFGTGCADSITHQITVNPIPVANFTSDTVCDGLGTTFIDLSTITSGSITNWAWLFGDISNGTSNIQNLTYNYAIAGTYNATLVITSDNGCVHSFNTAVHVHPNPVANFSVIDVCLNSPTQFIDSSTVTSPDVVNQWDWDFNPGLGTSSIQNPTFTYTSSGNHSTTLLVTTANGCTDSKTITGLVNELPQAGFGPEISGCNPVCVTMTNSTTINSGSLTYAWSFGDGSIASDETPSHCFQNSSNSSIAEYDVTLTATSQAGCVTSVTHSSAVVVYPIPLAHFEVSSGITDLYQPEISFSDLSIVAATWDWDFGDNTYSTDQNPLHEYIDTGAYMVTLYIENNYGCKDTTDKQVKIRPNFAVWIPNAFTPNGDGYNDIFYIEGFGIEEVELSIYNRWGELLYYKRADQTIVRWDGFYKGNIVQQDTYVYNIKIKDIFGEYQKRMGKVTVLK